MLYICGIVSCRALGFVVGMARGVVPWFGTHAPGGCWFSIGPPFGCKDQVGQCWASDSCPRLADLTGAAIASWPTVSGPDFPKFSLRKDRVVCTSVYISFMFAASSVSLLFELAWCGGRHGGCLVVE